MSQPHVLKGRKWGLESFHPMSVVPPRVRTGMGPPCSLSWCFNTYPDNVLIMCVRVSVAAGFPGGLDDKESARNAGDSSSIPGSGRSPGEGNGNPLQSSCLENSTDRGDSRATVHGIAKSWTWLSNCCVQLFATLWTVAHQASLSMGFPRWEYWSGLSLPTPGYLPDSGMEPTSLVFPSLGGGFLTTMLPGKPLLMKIPKGIYLSQTIFPDLSWETSILPNFQAAALEGCPS